jgi:predicted Zn-dependent protease with MMP-like domain
VATQEQLVHKVYREIQAPQVHREYLVTRVLQVRRAYREILEQLDLKESKEILGLQGRRAFKARQGLQVHRE